MHRGLDVYHVDESLHSKDGTPWCNVSFARCRGFTLVEGKLISRLYLLERDHDAE